MQFQRGERETVSCAAWLVSSGKKERWAKFGDCFDLVLLGVTLTSGKNV